MANFSAIANELTKKFVRSKNKKYTLNKIMYDLNYLVYSDTKQPLCYKAKSAIILHMFEIIAGRKELVLSEGETLTPNFADIVIFFERRSFILKHIKAGFAKQQELN